MRFFRGISTMKYSILITMILALNGTSTVSGSVPTARFLAEGTRNEPDETMREDPLDNYKEYRGGFNLTNHHYWASLIYTGSIGFGCASLWFTFGFVYGLFVVVRVICFCCCCLRHKRSNKKSRSPFKRPSPLFISAVFLSLLAILGCALVLGANLLFYLRAKRAAGVVGDTIHEVTHSLELISEALKNINTSLVEVDLHNPQATKLLNMAAHELSSRSGEINLMAKGATHMIDLVLLVMFRVIAALISLVWVLVIVLLVLGLFRFKRTLTLFIVVFWILTIIPWVGYGNFLVFYNLTGDTCNALVGFERNPNNNSLTELIPCNKLGDARSILMKVGKGINESVDKVNRNISTIYGDVIQICNPFTGPPSYEYRPWDCPPTSTKIGDIPRVLRMAACPDDEVKVCNGGIMVPGNHFRMVESYAISLQKFLDVYPNMESLVECKMIKDAFSELIHKHCKPLKTSLHLIWGSFLFLSIVITLLFIVWIVGLERRLLYERRPSHSSHGLNKT